MVVKIKDFFDDFTFHARVMPVLFISAPIIAMGIFKGTLHGGWYENSDLFFLSLIFLVMTSKIARNLGKSYETKMYKRLGGMPTTIVLRFSNDTFDNVTLKRYDTKLNQIVGLTLPVDKSGETADTDQQYIAAANFLRNYANSNRDKEQRVYQELKDYNFWRNLYGAKYIALVVYFVIIIREIILHRGIDVKFLFLHPYPDYIVLIVMVLWLVIFTLFVNRKAVQQKAFDYAKTLIEVCERIAV